MYLLTKRKNSFILATAALTVLVTAVSYSHGDAVCQYESHGKRDPFVPLVGAAAKMTNEGLKGVISIESISFQGVVMGADGKKMAIINGEMYRAGDQIGSIMIESVSDNETVVMINEKRHKLKLYQ